MNLAGSSLVYSPSHLDAISDVRSQAILLVSLLLLLHRFAPLLSSSNYVE